MNRFSRMIAAIRKRFNGTNTKDAKPYQASSQSQHANTVDRHRDNAASGGDRKLTTRGEAARRQQLS